MYIARALHLLFVVLLILVGHMAGLSLLYWLGVVVVAGLLVYEHRLVRADDLSRLSTAFMTVNSTVSLIYFAAILADLLVFGEGELLRL